jgi:hypothetical protein
VLAAVDRAAAERDTVNSGAADPDAADQDTGGG